MKMVAKVSVSILQVHLQSAVHAPLMFLPVNATETSVRKSGQFI
jgi:hypothetical protein